MSEKLRSIPAVLKFKELLEKAVLKDLTRKFRVGSKLKRTIYLVQFKKAQEMPDPGNDTLLGMLDDAEWAQFFVELANVAPDVVDYIDYLEERCDDLTDALNAVHEITTRTRHESNDESRNDATTGESDPGERAHLPVDSSGARNAPAQTE